MTKAMRMIEENIKIVDAVGYVLDARAPFACFNPEFEKFIEGKPCLFILNKCDLADDVKIHKWCEYFRGKGKLYVRISATMSAEASKISEAFFELTKELREKQSRKGVFKPTRCMILGVPNCGKSTIINCLSGRKTVITGDKPGVTKGKQWVRLKNGLELLDTPGTLWPKFENQRLAYELCFVGSIKDDVADICEVSQKLVEVLSELYPNCLELRYKVEVSDKLSSEVFDEIARKRGFLMRGGEIDSERTAKAILDDFRKGKLGQITFDEPSKQN